MGPEVFVIAFILYLMGDTVTRGKLTAIMRGTVKGTAKTTGRAAREGARNAHAQKLAYLDSGKAPLGRTRRRVGKAASGARRAAWQGAVDGVRSELEQLREAIEQARAEAESARADAQQPRTGKFGHSFDVIPALNPESPAPAPAEEAVDSAPPTLYGPDATAPEASTTAPTGQEGSVTMSAGTMTTGSGGPSVRVESVPGFIAAVEQLAQLGGQIHEQGIALGIGAAAQAGLQDAVDTLRSVAQQVRSTYQPLVEAADAVHQDAAAVTVGQARTE